MDSGAYVPMTALKLTVLGCGSGGPRPGIAASGYLITAAGTSLVLGLGSGALSDLRVDGDPAVAIMFRDSAAVAT
ncbi:MAG: hypothetical protein IIB04_05470 [Acidobacteria bacterium]|nr:hypothetical protein [Acidobacteriota bacterium]